MVDLGLPKKSCFFICAFGAIDSRERKWSDKILDSFLKPALKDYVVTRSLEYDGPDSLTHHIFEKLITADVVVADLTFDNPNVFFEMGVRHAQLKPIVHMSGVLELKLPFNVKDLNTVHLDESNPERTIKAIQDKVRFIELNPDKLATPVSLAADILKARSSQNAILNLMGETYQKTEDLVTGLLRKRRLLHLEPTAEVPPWDWLTLEQRHHLKRKARKLLEKVFPGKSFQLQPSLITSVIDIAHYLNRISPDANFAHMVGQELVKVDFVNQECELETLDPEILVKALRNQYPQPQVDITMPKPDGV